MCYLLGVICLLVLSLDFPYLPYLASVLFFLANIVAKQRKPILKARKEVTAKAAAIVPPPQYKNSILHQVRKDDASKKRLLGAMKEDLFSRNQYWKQP
jgi:hypothetical protein